MIEELLKEHKKEEEFRLEQLIEQYARNRVSEFKDEVWTILVMNLSETKARKLMKGIDKIFIIY